MTSKTEKKQQSILITKLELEFDTLSSDVQMQTFKKVIRLGTCDEVVFVNCVEDIANSFEGLDNRITAFGFAAVKGSDGSAFQERMMRKWSELVDTLESIPQRVKAIEEMGYKAVNDTLFCTFATKKWEETINLLPTQDKIEAIHSAFNKATKYVPLDKEAIEIGEHSDFKPKDGYFAFVARKKMRNISKEFSENVESSGSRRKSYEQQEDLQKMANIAKSLGYEI